MKWLRNGVGQDFLFHTIISAHSILKVILVNLNFKDSHTKKSILTKQSAREQNVSITSA